jgi:hypothetical protein
VIKVIVNFERFRIVYNTIFTNKNKLFNQKFNRSKKNKLVYQSNNLD